jgi:FkbM family methyltransferase
MAQNQNDPFWIQKRLMGWLGLQDPLVLDIGANKGQTIQNYRHILPRCRIHAFEPTPGVFRDLNQAFGETPGVTLYRAAVVEYPGPVRFYVNSMTSTNSTLPRPKRDRRYFPTRSKHVTSPEVPGIRLDDFWAQKVFPAPDIIKLDIQGGELPALRGAVKLLDEARPGVICTEVQFIPLYEGATNYHDLANFLRARGYGLYNLTGLHRSANAGQLTYGDAIFVSDHFRKTVLDPRPQEP